MQGFLQNSTRGVHVQSPCGAAVTSRFSNPFRRESSPKRSQDAGRTFEMNTTTSSYESLDSDPGPVCTPSTPAQPECKGEGRTKFRWSRIRQKLGRDPPKAALTILDQPLYSAGMKESTAENMAFHVPHDNFLNEIPRLPFPLISLPEAAMLQYFKRERGEEDHTDPASSFAGRARQGTSSTVSSSNCPRTPVSTQFGGLPSSPLVPLPLPPLTYRGDVPPVGYNLSHSKSLRRATRELCDSSNISCL